MGVILKDVYNLWNCSQTLMFHEDEYQHTHLAWNTLRGKIIYRDFEDTHGPLSTLLYAFYLKIKPRAAEAVSSFYYLRHWNLLAVFLTALFLVLSAFHLTRQKFAAALALLVYWSSPGIQSAAFRIRPDCYVALFSVMSIYCGLKRRPVLMGICLGLALGFHPKYLPIALGVMSVTFVLGLKKRFSFGRLLVGFFLVLGSIGIWAWHHRSFSFLYSKLLESNFRVAYQRFFVEGRTTQLLSSSTRTERWLGVLVAAILIWFLVRLIKERKFNWSTDWILAGAYTLFGLLFLFAPVWAHALVFVVPTVAVFVISLLFLWPGRQKFMSLLALIFCAWLSFSNLEKLDLAKGLEPVQFDSLELALKEIKRSEPIFYVWTSRCPAYVFNEDPSPNWMNPFRRKSGGPIRMLPPINYLSIHPMFLGLLDKEEQEYIKKNFKEDGCLWRRLRGSRE